MAVILGRKGGGAGGGSFPDPSGEPDGDVLTVSSGAAVWSPGGGSLPGTVLPVAAPTGVTVDDTTYDNTWLGSGKYTTLIGSADTVILAFAVIGDAFPRIVMVGNPTNGTFVGDGTVDPTQNGAAQWIEGSTVPGEFVNVIEGGGATQLRVGVDDPNVGRRIALGGNGITMAQGAPGDANFLVRAVDPNVSQGGNVGDVFIRSNGPDANNFIYRCTVAGIAGDATWVPLGGLT